MGASFTVRRLTPVWAARMAICSPWAQAWVFPPAVTLTATGPSVSNRARGTSWVQARVPSFCRSPPGWRPKLLNCSIR